MNAENDDALMKEFLVETYDALHSLRMLLHEIEKKPNDIEGFNFIFRAIHTLKGSASFLGLSKLKSLSHSIENLLDLLRNSKILFNGDLFDVLTESFDLIDQLLKKIEENRNEGDIDVDHLIVKLDLFIEVSLIEAAPDNKNAEKTSEVLADSQEKIVVSEVFEERKNASKDDLLGHKNESDDLNINAAPVQEIESKKTNSVVDSVVKVNVKLLDQLMNMVGELVVNRNQIIQYVGKVDDFELHKLTHQLDTITSELQNEIMATRMQPVGQVLNKFERVVRDLSKSQGKKILLSISGQETELDKTLIEAMKDPLTHLIRNAIDHGIEMSDERLRLRKPEMANLKLMAFHESGKVSIKIQDDGRGIDSEKIKSKAIEKGIITVDAAEKMSNKEIINLIFAPGFSTAEKITDISGRGVGMDVVRTNIEKIGGEIDIETVKGLGTTITLRIPLTLAIIPSLIVYSNEKAYCVPQLNIVEFVLLDSGQYGSTLYQMHGVNFIRLREKLIPIYELKSILESESTEKVTQLDLNGDFMNIVVVVGDGQEFGIVVDSIYDIEEIVVKPLSKNLKNLEYYSGATIMGNGEIALILETSSIIKKINPFRNKSELKNVKNQSKSKERNQSARDFLVFSLRDKKKYGIPVSFIDRIEEISKHSLNFSGTKIFTKYREHVVPLIDIQTFINPEMVFAVQEELLQVLMINVRGNLIGLIVENVFDIAFIEDDINEVVVNTFGVAGTVFVGDEAIQIMDTAQIFSSQFKDVFKKLDKKFIYHIDDSKMHRKILKDIIETEFSENIILNSFEGPVEFLEYLKAHGDEILKNSLIISDIDMPALNGWELIAKIQENYPNKDFIYFALTSRNHFEDREKSKDLKLEAHLKKFNKSEIVESINKVLGRGQELQLVNGQLPEKENLSFGEGQFCGFKIHNDCYAIPIMDVQEVVKAQQISKVPKSPHEVKGLMNLRGQIVTSISLPDVLSYQDKNREEHMNIIVKVNDSLASLMVDEILDVISFDVDQLDRVPDNVDPKIRKYFECVYKKTNEIVTVINTSSLLEDVL